MGPGHFIEVAATDGWLAVHEKVCHLRGARRRRGGYLRVRDAHTGEELRQTPSPARASTLAASPDGARLFLTRRDELWRIDPRAGRLDGVARPLPDGVIAVARADVVYLSGPGLGLARITLLTASGEDPRDGSAGATP
jgi:hypothetical protein